MKNFTNYIRNRIKVIGLFLLFSMVFICSFILYHLPLGAVIYPAFICAFFGVVFMVADYRKFLKKHRILTDISRLSAELITNLPEAVSQYEEDYQKIIEMIRQEHMQLKQNMDMQIADMIDYYTIWAHQIKTPIASMRLNLQNEDTQFSKRISEDLFRIEQYVEMVLCYLRLDSNTTDYVFGEYNLDDIIKQVVKKFAAQFIRRKIRLEYEPVNTVVLTDEKWLSFVLEQVISNALKYTQSGTIAVYIEKEKTLCIKDTGIGIAPQELPRIFEKGYTGYNGRSDKKASGIGLYLCRRICKNLGHTISAQSSLDNGTCIRICMQERKIKTE